MKMFYCPECGYVDRESDVRDPSCPDCLERLGKRLSMLIVIGTNEELIQYIKQHIKNN